MTGTGTRPELTGTQFRFRSIERAGTGTRPVGAFRVPVPVGSVGDVNTREE